MEQRYELGHQQIKPVEMSTEAHITRKLKLSRRECSGERAVLGVAGRRGVLLQQH
jgi:hypothetical protein